MDFRAKQIAPPKHWQKFEDLCLALFKAIWNDPLAVKNGRSGQPQHGVDVYGSPPSASVVFHGVQCKGKEFGYGSPATIDELNEEIAKADHFEPALAHWVFATTAARDQKLQHGARVLSKERKSRSLFAINVLGWEDIQLLLADYPNVLQQFYPEHAFDLPGLIEAIQEQRASGNEIKELTASVRELLKDRSGDGHGPVQEGPWELIGFEYGRDLGPALLGQPLGPSDAVACPKLFEVDLVVSQLRRAYSARLVGEPGTGKSVCGYQAALSFARSGWSVLRLKDARTQAGLFPLSSAAELTLLIVDDAHLMAPHVLRRLEDAAGPRTFVMSLHNGIKNGGSHPGAVLLDSRRAVRTIAAGLRAQPERTLEVVRRADDHVGGRHLEVPLERRIDDAESSSDRPWQFCFVLGGGWRRAKEAADSARVAGADVVLAAAAIHQVASRDAPLEIAGLQRLCGLDDAKVHAAVTWLLARRLLLSGNDCRCPHQRFAVVVLHEILGGQNDDGRKAVANILGRVLGDPAKPLAGLRILLHELYLSPGDFGRWKHLVETRILDGLIGRCWSATTGEEVAFAAYLLSDMKSYLEEWPHRILGNNVDTIGRWISAAQPPSGYGLYHLINAIHHSDESFAQTIATASDAQAVGRVLSQVVPETALHLGELLKGLGLARTPEWSKTFKQNWDTGACLALAETWPASEPVALFASFCSAVAWWHEDLALAMVERFLPIARAALAENPTSAFNELDGIAMQVLRVSDPLGAYVGKHRPDARRLKLARSMCANLNPKALASQISEIRKRDFQSATFLLGFLRTAAKAKFDATVMALDWKKLEDTIGDDWSHLPHETQIFLTVGYLNPAARDLIAGVVSRNLHQIEILPVRVAVAAPSAAALHVINGKEIAIGREWRFGAALIAMIAPEHPMVVEKLLAPSEKGAAATFSQPHPSWYRDADMFIEVVKEAAPASLQRILDSIELAGAEAGWIASIKAGGQTRRTVSFLIEAALPREDAVGEMARRVRARFPKTSIPIPREEGKPIRKRH